MATTRTEATPWMVVDVMTNDVLGYYETEAAAVIAHPLASVDIQYRPKRKRKAGRKFP